MGTLVVCAAIYTVVHGQTINCNEPLIRDYLPQNGSKYYSFTAQSNTAIYFSTCKSVPDTILTVYDPNNLTISQTNTSKNCVNKASMDLVNMTNGNYTIKLSARSGHAENYQIQMNTVEEIFNLEMPIISTYRDYVIEALL